MTTATAPAQLAKASYLRVFLALVSRDAAVARRELGTVIAQGVVQPFLMLFIFGHVIASLGFADSAYPQLLYPGTVAMVTVLTALQTSAMPLVVDFATGREIEDRLLAPVPTALVAVEKIVFAALRSLFTAALMIPIGILVLGEIPLPAAGIPLAVAAVLLGALVGSSIGVLLGTALPPTKLNVMFALIFAPLMFTGAAQYPWLMLDDLRWFQVLTAANPLTYFSEAMRAALLPDVPHLNPWLSMGVLLVATVGLGALAVRGFLRRAVR